MHSIIIRWHSLILSVLPQLRSMYSSRLSSSYFIFASFILISIPPYCAGNEYHVNGNNPSQFLNVQTLRRLLQTADDPIKAVPACQGTGNRYILSCPTNGYYRPSSPQTPLISPPPPNIADTPPPSSPPSIAPQPKNADTPPPSSPPSSIAPQPKNDIPTRNYPSPSTQGSPNGGRHSKRQHLAIAIASAVLGIVLISFVIIYTIKRGNLSRNKMVCWERGTRKYPFNDEEIMKNFGSMVPKQYTYSEVKKVTNSFKNKLGQGGYGIVYKGKLLDGRLVAVKVLNESKDNGEDFINEVASISRTSHVNIVNLVGFCYERNSRALIYEFMANGSLDQFIYNKSSSLATCHLDEKTMFRIAIGIARGLEYLHRGCRTRILHFDIKPHNILLDEDMCPKISDFGLAKLCRKKESIVSMTNMRGTIGYIAPEVFSRNFGVVSHKSDVYSFGMLILEMIGGRKNFDGEVSCSSERDFSHWIYTKLENGKILDTFGEGIEEEENVIKKMILVGLWCIQTNPYDRPSIGKVIEMLEGTLQSLQFPPKPFLYSPPLSPQNEAIV